MAKKFKTAAMILVWIALICGIFKTVMLFACDRILIFGYRGLENMFRLSYADYYAAIGSFHVKVPGFAVKLVYPKDKNNGYSVYRDDETTRYYVQLIYNDERPHGNILEHGHNGEYTIEYVKKGPAEHEMDPADEELAAVMLDITEQLYDLDHVYDPENDKWIARSGGNTNVMVTAFMLFCYDSGYLLEQDDDVLYCYKDGKLGKIMDRLAADEDALAHALKGKHEEILEAMQTLRVTVDELEKMIPDSNWPLPKYREMLFIY